MAHVHIYVSEAILQSLLSQGLYFPGPCIQGEPCDYFSPMEYEKMLSHFKAKVIKKWVFCFMLSFPPTRQMQIVISLKRWRDEVQCVPPLQICMLKSWPSESILI